MIVYDTYLDLARKNVPVLYPQKFGFFESDGSPNPKHHSSQVIVTMNLLQFIQICVYVYMCIHVYVYNYVYLFFPFQEGA
jgi:hypothetical protein